MNPALARTGIILALAFVIAGVVLAARGSVARRRTRVLAASPMLDLATIGHRSPGHNDAALVRILVFSSNDCAQCHRLQAPAIQRVLAARGSSIATVEIDAPTSPELTERYQILTLPSTAILDASGRTHAINYGFANSTKLLQQVDALLALLPQEAAV
jgi:hypothetical protein